MINRVGPAAVMISTVPRTKTIRSRVNTRDSPEPVAEPAAGQGPEGDREGQSGSGACPTCHRASAEVGSPHRQGDGDRDDRRCVQVEGEARRERHPPQVRRHPTRSLTSRRVHSRILVAWPVRGGATRRRTQVRSGRSGQSTKGLLAATSEPNAHARSEIGVVGPGRGHGTGRGTSWDECPSLVQPALATRATGPSGRALSVSSARLSVAGERYPVGPEGDRDTIAASGQDASGNPQPHAQGPSRPRSLGCGGGPHRAGPRARLSRAHAPIPWSTACRGSRRAGGHRSGAGPERGSPRRRRAATAGGGCWRPEAHW